MPFNHATTNGVTPRFLSFHIATSIHITPSHILICINCGIHWQLFSADTGPMGAAMMEWGIPTFSWFTSSNHLELQRFKISWKWGSHGLMFKDAGLCLKGCWFGS